ncbi:unannotated protein [freshwater metagenome]|uniref:Unannotated protein n=1 Tax=freshwater metagenome TaxID=449393 RepID=A0A6J6ATZ5_9ZZZZ|nr:hypothetical protein [Actinomycetota bacterium]
MLWPEASVAKHPLSVPRDVGKTTQLGLASQFLNTTTVVLAFTVGLSPLAALASLLLLSSEKGTTKAAALAVGWVAAVAVVGFGTLFLEGQVDSGSGSVSSTITAVIDIALGVAALLAALRVRRQEQHGGKKTPKWLSRLDQMSPLPALVLGAFLPPYALVVSGANNILKDYSSQTAQLGAMAVFTLVASIDVLLPLAVVLGSRHPAPVLAKWRGLLLEHWPKVLLWLFLLIGLYLVAKGVLALV